MDNLLSFKQFAEARSLQTSGVFGLLAKLKKVPNAVVAYKKFMIIEKPLLGKIWEMFRSDFQQQKAEYKKYIDNTDQSKDEQLLENFFRVVKRMVSSVESSEALKRIPGLSEAFNDPRMIYMYMQTPQFLEGWNKSNPEANKVKYTLGTKDYYKQNIGRFKSQLGAGTQLSDDDYYDLVQKNIDAYEQLISELMGQRIWSGSMGSPSGASGGTSAPPTV